MVAGYGTSTQSLSKLQDLGVALSKVHLGGEWQYLKAQKLWKRKASSLRFRKKKKNPHQVEFLSELATVLVTAVIFP